MVIDHATYYIHIAFSCDTLTFFNGSLVLVGYMYYFNESESPWTQES